MSTSSSVNIIQVQTPINLTPNSVLATNGVPAVIPAGVKSFSVANLGDGTGAFGDIACTGGYVATIPGAVSTQDFSVSDDVDNVSPTSITVTPVAGQTAFVSWLS